MSKSEATFTLAQFQSSKHRPAHEKDILAAVLDHNKTYSISEAEKAMGLYQKRRVY